ncbi:MAG: transcriptional repressor [Planctomycetes bacterium]|nr:transcriptional repressor [Planctomycetota bacterium]
MCDVPSYEEVLRQRGLSVTRLRLAILTALHGMGSAATASGLLARLRVEHSVHNTTAYRNLATLEKAGLVRRIPSGARSFLYELSCPHARPVHPHFTCRGCGKVVCLPPIDLAAVWELLSVEGGLSPERAHVTLVGLCGQCAAAQAEEPG